MILDCKQALDEAGDTGMFVGSFRVITAFSDP